MERDEQPILILIMRAMVVPGSNDGSTPDGNRFDSCYEWFKTSEKV